MKKAFLIFFVLVAAIGACFAETADKLILTTEIEGAKPEFRIYGNTVEGTQSGANVKVSSPVVDAVAVEILVKQSDDARYKGTFNITVTATALSNVDTSKYPNQTTETPTVTALTSKVTDNENFAVSTSSEANVVTLGMNYKTGSKVAKCDVATWKFVWAQAENLAQGTYQGTVTLSYTAP